MLIPWLSLITHTKQFSTNFIMNTIATNKAAKLQILKCIYSYQIPRTTTMMCI
uniref:Uncharacterized protein n=1 Tax=Rhizophora mucronata TaxID=61149 RepID=A0A2P2PF17_RHIMU